MGNVGSLEHHGFRSKFVQIGRVNLYSAVTGYRVRSLLIRQKEDQIRFARELGWLRDHGING